MLNKHASFITDWDVQISAELFILGQQNWKRIRYS